METAILIILIKAFIFLVLLVGGYVYMFLHIMRSDPREIDYRKKHNLNDNLLPK